MPKQKKIESDSDSDSGPDDRDVAAKKAKTSESGGSASSTGPKRQENNGEVFWEFGDKRRATVRRFKGTLFVDIREFYMDKEGELKPGKKGISLRQSDFNTLKELIPHIEKAIKEA